MRALTSRKSVVIQEMNVPKSSRSTYYFGHTQLFYFRIIASKKESLVVTFDKTRAHTSRKCVVFMNFLKSFKKRESLKTQNTHLFLLYSNSLKMLIFDVFLPEREPLVTTFSEKRAVISLKDIIKQCIKILKL